MVSLIFGVTMLVSIFTENRLNGYQAISGESASVTTETTAPWNETTFPILLSNFKLVDLFNAD